MVLGSGERVVEGPLGVLGIHPNGSWSIDWSEPCHDAMYGSGSSCGPLGLFVFLMHVDDEHAVGERVIGLVDMLVRDLTGMGVWLADDDADMDSLSFSSLTYDWRWHAGQTVDLYGYGDLGVMVNHRTKELWYRYKRFDAAERSSVVMGPVPIDDAVRDIARLAESNYGEDDLTRTPHGLLGELLLFGGYGSDDCRISSDALVCGKHAMGMLIGSMVRGMGSGKHPSIQPLAQSVDDVLEVGFNGERFRFMRFGDDVVVGHAGEYGTLDEPSIAGMLHMVVPMIIDADGHETLFTDTDGFIRGMIVPFSQWLGLRVMRVHDYLRIVEPTMIDALTWRRPRRFSFFPAYRNDVGIRDDGHAPVERAFLSMGILFTVRRDDDAGHDSLEAWLIVNSAIDGISRIPDDIIIGPYSFDDLMHGFSVLHGYGLVSGDMPELALNAARIAVPALFTAAPDNVVVQDIMDGYTGRG